MRAVALLLLTACLLTACSLTPIDYVGKACPTGECPGTLSCIANVCRAEGFDAGALDAGADGGLSGDAGTTGFVSLSIDAGDEDAMWNGTTELLVGQDLAVEVGLNGAEVMAARFPVPLPKHATVMSAQLQVLRVTGNMGGGSPLTVHVWDSLDVPPFDSTHVHAPELHASGGFRAETVTMTSEWHPFMQSEDLTPLLQPLLDRADWHEGAVVGFVITATASDSTWLGVADFTNTTPDAFPFRLAISYRY